MIPQNQKLSSPRKFNSGIIKSGKFGIVILFVLINIVLSAVDCFPQQGWFWLNMSAYSSHFRSSFVLNPNCAYLGNDEGILFLSYNYGSSLIPFNTGTGSSIQGIHFLNPLTGYVAVESIMTGGTCGVLKTTNGGLTWNTLYNSQNQIFTCVYFINEQTGFAGGGYWTSLLKTSNGGVNWTNVSPQQADKPSSFCFVNETTGFAGTNAGYNGNIYKTTNQGDNWSVVYHLPNPNSIPHVRFFNALTGVALTNEYPDKNRILRTTDCGLSWNTVKTDSNLYYTWLSVTNDSTAVAAGDYGLLRMTYNRGLNWYDINCDTSKLLSTANFLNYNTGFISGIQGFYSKTTNHGISWNTFEPALNSNILNSSFLNAKTGYASAEGGNILTTKNGGVNWSVKNLNTTYSLVSVSFFNENYGIAGSSHGQIFKTTNGGINWTAILSAGSPAHYSIKMFDSLRYSSLDESCVLSKSYNGGISWLTYNIPLMWLTGGFIKDSLNYYAVDYLGGFSKSTNGGINWSNNVIITNNIMCGVYFTDNNNGYIVGSSGTALKTTNGGLNWNQMNFNSSFDLKCVYFIDQSTGYICGNNGLIKKTTNAGATWYSQISTSGSTLNNLIFPYRDTGYVFGDNGTILKTITCGDIIGIKPVNSSAPPSFALYQNYPNPFNPSTKIKFDIKNAAFVSMKIFDITGKEIAALVNERLKPGTYEVNFNAYDYGINTIPSGVYFYSLSAGKFRETKKMILIK